jgi:hypothetical protein
MRTVRTNFCFDVKKFLFLIFLGGVAVIFLMALVSFIMCVLSLCVHFESSWSRQVL